MQTYTPGSAAATTMKILLFVFGTLAFFLSASIVDAATLSVSPSTGVHTVGTIFSASVRVNTQGSPINAAEGTLKFDPQKLQVISVAKGSIFNLWTADPSFSNSAGTISFGGGSPSGYTGSAGTVMTIQFRAKSAGATNVKFTNGSVLAADGRGTNVLTSMNSGAYTLAANDVPAEPEVIEYVAPANTPAAPSVTSSSHPDPDKWYATKEASLSWDIPSGVTSVRTLLDSNSGSVPTKVYETPINSITINDLDEGVQYFHIQFQNSDGWGRIRHYRLAVDSEKPTSFDIALKKDSDPTAPEQVLVFDVEDTTSSVERFLIQLDGGEPYEFIDETGSSTHSLPSLEPGYHTVIVEAFDRAGNSIVSTFSFTILSFDKPEFTNYPSQINSEVIPVISGQTRPNAKVAVTVTKIGAQPVTYEMTSDDAGVFNFIPDSTWQNGVYELYAIAIDQHGAQSDPSDIIRIAVQDPGYIQIGSMIVGVLSVLVPLIALVVLLVLIVLVGVARMRKVSRFVKRETHEALDVLEREFNSLQLVLTEQSNNLKKKRKTNKLTKTETELIETLKATIAKTKERVKKEVSDVDDIIE